MDGLNEWHHSRRAAIIRVGWRVFPGRKGVSWESLGMGEVRPMPGLGHSIRQIRVNWELSTAESTSCWKRDLPGWPAGGNLGRQRA